MILPGGFSHGDYLRTGAIARFSPVMKAVGGVRRRRRAGPRHLQRLPDPARGRPAARRDAPQPRPEVPLRARLRPRRADRHAVHRALRHAARCCACRSPTARATTSPTPDVIAELETNRQVVFRYVRRRRRGHRRRQPERLAPQHRRHLQRGAQRRRPDAASRARLRSGRSAAPTGCVIFESVIALAGVADGRPAAQRVTSTRYEPPSTPLSSSATASTPDEYDRIVARWAASRPSPSSASSR